MYHVDKLRWKEVDREEKKDAEEMGSLESIREIGEIFQGGLNQTATVAKRISCC